MLRLKTKFCLCCLHFPTFVSFENYCTCTPTKRMLKPSCWTSLLHMISASSISAQTAISVFFAVYIPKTELLIPKRFWVQISVWRPGIQNEFPPPPTLPGGNCQVSALIKLHLPSSTFFEISYPAIIIWHYMIWSIEGI
jgi:hypothetical protein